MNLDFALILVLATAITGLIWAADALYFRRRRAASGRDAGEPAVVEYARSFFPIILIVLVIRSFGYEPFRIPSGSMMPTLLAGDFIFVNKWIYGLRLPVANVKIVPVAEPERGDVVVFRLPTEAATTYIKRVVGLPGDVIEYRDERLLPDGREVPELSINGEPVPVEIVEELRASGTIMQLGLERIDDADHRLYYEARRGAGRFRNQAIEWRHVVPDGHYFVMGDNRDRSKDSRFQEVGFIPEDRLVGKAVRIWMNWDPDAGRPLWRRIGDAIR